MYHTRLLLLTFSARQFVFGLTFVKHCQQEEALDPTVHAQYTYMEMYVRTYGIHTVCHALSTVHLHTLLYYVLNLHCMYLQYMYVCYIHMLCVYVCSYVPYKWKSMHDLFIYKLMTLLKHKCRSS